VLNVMTGDPVTVTGVFKDTAGNPFDPATVMLEWGRPRTPTTWTYGTGVQITKISTGVYQATFSTLGLAGSQATTCYAQFIGTDSGTFEPNNYADFQVHPRPL
jgi:hypothetical protein